MKAFFSISVIPSLKVIIPVFTLAFVMAAAPVVEAAAKKRSLVSRHRDWEVHRVVIDGENVCYAAALPKKSTGKYTRRDEASILVSYWPKRNVRGQIEIRAGYPYKKGETALLEFDEGGKYRLPVQKESAWARNAAQDAQVVAEMKEKVTLTVVGYSSRGTKTTDTYSLRGFTKAVEGAAKACAK